jgi:hypothetical protein
VTGIKASQKYLADFCATMNALVSSVLLMLLASGPAAAGSLKDIEHVVIFMQENRSWNNVSPILTHCEEEFLWKTVFWHHGRCSWLQ